MQNKFTPEIKKIIQDGNDTHFVEELKKMSGKNWYREVKSVSHEMGLNAKELIYKIATSLENSLNGKEIKKDLAGLKKYYQESFQEFEEDIFEKSEKIVDAMADYLEKAKNNIMAIMLEGPDAKQRLIEQHKSILDKSSPSESKDSVEKKNIKLDTPEEKEDQLLAELTSILDSGMSDEEIVLAIKSSFTTIYKKSFLVMKTFYKILGLDEKYIPLCREIHIRIVKLLVLIKKNPSDDHARADLEREIDRISHPTFKTEGEQDIKKPGVKIISTIDLSGKDTNRFKKPEQKTQEEKQAPTTNPLEEVVGKTMTHQEFISACGLSYEEIRKYEMKGESMPARYLSYNKTPQKDKSIAHFFTIGEEVKGIHRVPINVFIAQDPNKTFNEGEIYEIKVIGMLDSKKSGDTKQSKSVQGELVIEEPESTPGKSVLGDHPQFKKLLRVT